ncbi:hypothetical protein GGR55DRAFT_696640 [Xylaria sp. FL0064]|nr:hypothetical protein GGR55DRAFT_696640 [Xylaria sp. FL0064]
MAKPGGMSAWLVRTLADDELVKQQSLSSRHLSFPCRLCFAFGKPITPTTARHQNLSTASCALDIGGKLYVITSTPFVTASSPDGTRNGIVWNDQENDCYDDLLESARLGRVVYTNSQGHFSVIEVADTFRACQDPTCSECSIPLNNNWLGSKGGASYAEVKIPTLRDPRNEALNPRYGNYINLSYKPQNEGEASFEHYNIHQGPHGMWPNSGHWASMDDSGSLVICDAKIIGITTDHHYALECRDHDHEPKPCTRVLLLDAKLWALFMRLSDKYFNHLKDQTGPLTVTRAYRHLEYQP